MYSIWVTPADKDNQYLSRIIQELSNKFTKREFQPHCTLWSKVDLPLGDLVPIVKSNALGIVPFIVKVKEIDYSQSYSKTLFIQLYANESLSILYQRIKNTLGDQFVYHFPRDFLTMSYNRKINKL